MKRREPPVELDRAVTFAPSGKVVVSALSHLRKGGVVAINAIHLDQMPAFDYDKLLWGERQIRSVANMTGRMPANCSRWRRPQYRAGRNGVSACRCERSSRSREARNRRGLDGDCSIGIWQNCAVIDSIQSAECSHSSRTFP